MLYRCEGDQPTSWFVCDNWFQLRIVLEVVPHDSFHHLISVERPIDIDIHEEDCQKCEFQQEEEPSIEEQNNAEPSSTPATQMCLELNDISMADQTSSCSVQQNDIEARCKHQKTLEDVLKGAPAQEFFERKLSKTWKQECTTYDDLNRNAPSFSPHGDQSQNFANSGFVKSILNHTRKKLNMALDISVIANCESPCVDEPSANVNNLEIQERQNDCSSPEEVVVTVKDCCKSLQAISQQQQKGENLLCTSYAYTSFIPRPFPSFPIFHASQAKTILCTYSVELKVSVT